ncbi:MAG: type IV secretion system protein [Endozoicomonadaceae bacterium]|nr:type IV secretion system protein [Endozoicomonadaceae bacterium]
MTDLMHDVTAHTIIIRLFEWIELFLQYYVIQGYQALSHLISTSLGIILALYIMIRGYSVAMGLESISIATFFKHSLKICFMYFLAMQWHLFSSWLVEGVAAIADCVAAAELSANPLQLPLAYNLKTALQSTFSQFYFLGSELWKQGGLWSNPTALLSGLMIWGEGSLLVGIGTTEILLAKIVLSVLFTIAPLIGILSLFKPFQGVLDAWLGFIISFVFLEILVTAVLIIALSLAYSLTGSHMMQEAISGVSGLGLGWPIFIVAVLCIVMIMRINTLSMALGRVSASTSASANIQQIWGHIWRPATTIFKTSLRATQAIKSPFRRRF